MSTVKPKSFDDLYREAETHDDYWIAGVIQGFTEEISRLMEAQKVTRAELARRLGTSPAYVTKILRGNANFTLASMTKIAAALGSELRLRLAPRDTAGRERVERSGPSLSGEANGSAERMVACPRT